MSKRRRLLVVLTIVIAALVMVSFFYWFVFLRPIKTYELANNVFESGQSVDLAGIITDVEQINTSYTPMTLLQVGNNIPYQPGGPSSSFFCCLIGDISKEHKINDQIQQTLHFEEYYFNGIPINTAGELYSPLFFLPTEIAETIDAVSFFIGFELLLKSIDGQGTTTYEIFTKNNDTYPLDMFNATLLECDKSSNGTTYDHVTAERLFQNEYLSAASGYSNNEKIDFMPSLTDGVSQKNVLHFIDLNANDLLDDHDLFTVYIPPTGDEHRLETYFLIIGGEEMGTITIAGGVKYIINWYNGAFEHREPRNIFSEQDYTKPVSLTYASNKENGTFIDTTITISQTRLQGGHPYTKYYFLLTVDDTEYYHDYYNRHQVSEGTVSINENITITYSDTNTNDLLDGDDMFIINGVENQSYVQLMLFDDETYGNELIRLTWIAGHGYIKGNIPRIDVEKKTLIPESDNIYQLNISVEYYHPVLALNSTVRVSLFQDSQVILDNVLVKDGVIESYHDANLSFVDADNDSFLSTNDYFKIECKSPGSYKLKFPSLFGTYSSHTFVLP
jgi:hypothetical protein